MDTKASLASTRQPVGFLDIPLEIRRQIYHYCLVRQEPVIVDLLYLVKHHGTSDRKTSLLLVSKKVGFETLEVLYGDNVFSLYLNTNGEHFPRRPFTEVNMRRIRKLQVVLHPYGQLYGRMLDSTLWSPILARLTKLSIVAKQPLYAQRYFGAPSFEKELKKWIEWLKPILQYFARQLSSYCIVEADDDDRRETSTLIRECLPSRYRKVQTLTGDILFRRNEDPLESGCRDKDSGDDDDIDSSDS